MNDSLSLTIDKRDMDRIMKKLSNLAVTDRSKDLFKGFVAAGAVLANRLMNNCRGGILHKRTGFLSSSIGSKVEEVSGDLQATVGSGVLTGKRMPYANIHENGGVIRPKNGKYLCIPIRAGSGYAIDNGMWTYKRGKKKGQNKKAISFSSQIIGFRKVEKVTIPARHYMSRTVTESKETVMKTFLNAVNKAIAA